jgi:leucyl-tRNA synthetase
VPVKDLPVKLPEVKSYEPSGTGESPLAKIESWVKTKCPKCGGPARRETNTMPQWAGSSWYYLRFIDPQNKKALVDKTKEKYWSPVDMYVGGAEHATRHLIYARFWHKFLYDIGAVSYLEPFTRLKSVGLIMGADGRKMSKRWGNVINPDEIVSNYGADTLRLYEMFMGPFDQPIAWNTDSVIGARRFIERVWKLAGRAEKAPLPIDLDIALNRTIKKVGEDIENFSFNTAISALMILSNDLEKHERVPLGAYETLIRLIAPFAPHMAEELWRGVWKKKKSIVLETWPKYDEKKLTVRIAKYAVQVNGRLRDAFEVPTGTKEKEVLALALKREAVQKWTLGQKPKKMIFVPDRLVNIVL